MTRTVIFTYGLKLNDGLRNLLNEPADSNHDNGDDDNNGDDGCDDHDNN